MARSYRFKQVSLAREVRFTDFVEQGRLFRSVRSLSLLFLVTFAELSLLFRIDFVGTLTEPISQGYYCRSREDWKWLERKKKKRKENSENENCSQSEAIPEVVVKLRELYEEG